MSVKAYPPTVEVSEASTLSRFWEKSVFRALGIEDVIEVGRHAIRRTAFAFPTHVHGPNRMEVCYLAKGRHTYLINGQPYTMAGGDVIVIFPGETHGGGGGLEERGTMYWLTVELPKPARGQSFVNQHGRPAQSLVRALWAARPRRFAATPALRNHLMALYRLLDGGESGLDAAMLIAVHVLSTLVELVRCAAEQRRTLRTAWSRKIADFVREHVATPIGIHSMANSAGMSVSGFNERFRREFGTSPMDYVAHRRIALARQAIAQVPHHSFTRIAMDMGFSSSQNFTTAFRQHTGMTPGQFRKSRAGDRADWDGSGADALPDPNAHT